MVRFEAKKTGKCPHCLTTVRFDHVFYDNFTNQEWSEGYQVFIVSCPECHKIILSLLSRSGGIYKQEYLLYPFGNSRPPIPVEVPPYISEDYNEAALILPFSPKASAALSRRCLQTIIRDYFKITKSDLFSEIQSLIDTGKLPPYLSDSIDSIRVIGKFAAHPNKSKTTGEIIQVEPEEAEWNLDVLESLFEFCYRQPALIEQKKEILKAKLADVEKKVQ